VALEVALSYPDRVAGLILTGSSGLFERGFTRHVPHCPTTEYVRQKMEEVFYVAERFHALIPESQLWLLNPCGHAPMLEQPQAFNAPVREWLDGTWLRRAQVTLAGAA
jgi:pimeloyl-ACP methyl ester carboxylesterase